MQALCIIKFLWFQLQTTMISARRMKTTFRVKNVFGIIE